ncbi:Lipopolysaccharide export system ATP-binding protein LptB [Kordia antarctica]|uniref:Lipopolysaccharide export system ATP-binding protein LptB n=1 Tax=Kordia antarctica TaxID=1218801 RepID=A0A7L4ZEZ6_9FLAO|nr:ABC transporter ATP-binding protein [Kordia antarctica]QHI35137.1 Lipopolysaccharide export system ATP-binding protein LptB [Kordia antarctica]
MYNTEKINIPFISDTEIEADFPNSYDLIFELSNFLLPNSVLIYETILLGSAISYRKENGITPAQSKEYLEMSLDLLAKIQHELKETQNLDDWNKVHNLRNHFLQKFNRKVILEISNITKSYPRSNFSLNDISIKVYSGEIIGIIGKNGNGKTTLLKIIGSIIQTDSGTVEYPGISYNYKNKFSTIKKSIAYIPQKIKDWGNLDTLKTQLHFIAAIKGIIGKENTRVVNHFIERLNLDKYKDLYWREISGGIQLRFEIAKALIWMPHLIILDEPLANLDVKAQTKLLSDLRNITNSVSNPTAILISSQNLYELEKISDKVIFLKDGNVLHNGPVDNIGVNNKFNCYQIDSALSLNKLKFILNNDMIKNVEADGEYYLIYTSKDCKKEQMLRLLVDSQIPINYFRDITNSTRILFESKKA